LNRQPIFCLSNVGNTIGRVSPHALCAARSFGLRTGFIYRPNEFGGGPVGVPDKAKPGDFDIVSTSIIDLAQQLGA
jgi:hypothetical protein